MKLSSFKKAKSGEGETSEEDARADHEKSAPEESTP